MAAKSVLFNPRYMATLESSRLLVLSPHPDDAVLSCGGLLAKNHSAKVLTLFASDPPQPRPPALAERFVDQETRRREDTAAMAHLSCAHEFLDHPDAIDRVDEGERVYSRVEAIFGAIAAADLPLVPRIEAEVTERLDGRILLCPLAVGAHVDHQICAHVGRRLQRAGHATWFYQDAPYVFPDPGPRIAPDTVLKAAARMRGRVRGVEDVVIDRRAKEEALACYSSQIEALFGDMQTYLRLANRHYENLGFQIERFHLLSW